MMNQFQSDSSYLCGGRHCDSAKQCQRAIRLPRGVLGKYAAYDINKDKDAAACEMFISIQIPDETDSSISEEEWGAATKNAIAEFDSEGGQA